MSSEVAAIGTNADLPLDVDAEHVEVQRRADCRSPFDPYALTKYGLLDAASASKLYMDECQAAGLHINSTFVKQVQSGTTVFEFDNGYLGEHGIIPIMKTLRQLPIEALLLPKCELEADDIQLICETFTIHPSLQRMDLRGNLITLSSAKLLMTLVVRNTSITEVLMNPLSPKYVQIQRQCCLNANVIMNAGNCLSCNHPMTHTPTKQIESTLITVLLENFRANEDHVSVIEVEAIFRIILSLCAKSHGVLFLCSETCVEHIAGHIYACVRGVIKTCNLKVPFELPKHPQLRAATEKLIKEISGRKLPASAFSGVYSILSDEDALEKYFDENLDRKCTERCSVCGSLGTSVLPNGGAVLLLQLREDLKKGAPLNPTAVVRLCKVMIQHATVRPCSRKCTRQLIRYALYGYGGITRSLSVDEPLLTTTGVNLDGLPAGDFALINYTKAVVDRLDDEEISCALSVASLMEDIEGIPIDPYMIFAMGRHLQEVPSSAIGMQLQCACEAVRLVGCLPASEAPFHRREGDRPLRESYAHWGDWAKLGDVERLLHIAFARRRMGAYAVDGPHGNNFDNVRAALWAFREQKRCAVVVMKVSLRWLNLPGGVIPESVTPRGGFYTTVKVVGQTTIDNNQHLIIQGNFGTQAGKNGFFYIPKSIFNRYAPGLPYMFVDVAMFRDTMNPLQLGTASTFAMKHVQPVVLDSARHQQQAFHALQNLLMAVSSTQPVPRSIMHRLSAILHRVPPAFFFAFQKNWSGASRTQLRWIKYVLRLIRGVRMHSQLLFCANEIMSTKVSEWIEDVLSRQHFPSPARVALSRCAASPQSSQHAITHRKPHADLRWTSVEIMADHFPEHPAPPPPPEPVVPEVVAEPEPVPANPKQRPPIGKRGGAAAPAPPAAPAKPPSAHKKRRPKRISDDLGDPARANLEQYWTIERQRTIAKESLGRTNGGDQMLSGAALFRAMAATKSPARSSSVSDPLGRSYLHPSFADLKDSLHPRLLGRPWQVMHIVEENESLSEFVALFIDDCISIYDCQKQLVVCDVAPVKKNEIFAHLPFSSGFDCLFHNPRAPREVYFISGGHWIVWDAYTQQTLAGPYGLDAHDKFKKLPAPFLDHIDAAVAVPSTPYVLFFTQLCYVVFDMETSLPVCPPFFLRPPDEELLRRQKREKDDPLMELKREKRKHHARDEAPPPVPPRLPEGAPSFSPTLQVSLPHGPMAAMWPMTQAEGKRVVLIGSDGNLITTDLCAPDDLTMTVVNPIMHSTLANTPLEYRQMTTDALPSVISSLCIRHFSEPFNPEIRQVHLLEVEGSSHLVSRSNSNSTGSLAQHGGGLIMGNEPATVVDATFIKTTLAEELPLSISRVTSARQGCALLSQEVFFSEGRNAALRSHAASDEVPHSVEFDLGDDRAESLGAVILVLNTARIHREILQLAPLRVTVESSDDRIAYRPHGSFLAEGTFTPSCWAKSHAARYWRLRFHTQLPPGVGITRIFWYRAEWILATGALSVLEPYSPAVNTVVMDVQAARLWRPASSLVEPLGTSPVFALAGREGWRQKHAILPLLGEARSCLFFCGNGFVEYDMNQFEVVSSRSLSLLQHPAFIELPTPFNLGFDAIFYPDFETSPDTVVIVRDGLCVWWSLQEGSLSDRVKRCDETLFRGIPINMDVVVDIVNAWDAPGEVWVMYRSENLQMHALRWHVEHHRIIAGPSEWSEFPNLYSPEVKPEHEVLCMTSCPFNPSTFYIFFDESVVSSITSGSRKISLDKHTMAPPLAKLSREFYRMTLYLNMWGKRLQYCTITVDLREHMRQLLGMELRSSRGDQTTWSVEYSDDGREWKRVTQHIQRDSLSVTTWKPSMVKNCSHRYWRFHTEGLQHIGHADLDEEPSVYSQLRFLILPLQLHRELPSRAVFSGTLNGTVGSWLRREGATLAFESRMMEGSKDASAADLEEAHFISLDYGHSPVELSGFSCRCTTSTSGRSNDLWTIFCSDDGEDWKQCGSWRSFFSIACAHWFIGRPYRFWRIELRAKQSCPVFDHFHFYRYDGPSIVLLDRGEGSLMTPGTQLLWQSDALHVENSLEASQVGMHFRTHLGNTITLDTKSATAPIVGLELHALACSSPKVEFVVECSDDGARWTGVGTLIFYAEGHRRALSTWDITDSHRFWRLRLTYSAIPAASMRLESVQARVAKSDLYVTYLSAPSAEPEMVHLHLPVQRNVVRVKAVLPPLSEYVVEKLALDCIGWEFVATLVNVEESERTIVKGWMTGVPSASWRMRYQGRPGSASLSPLERDLSLGGDGGALMLPPPPPISVPVRWYAFSAMRVLPVPINTVLDVDVSIERFEELAPAMDLLTSNDPSHPILQFTSPSIPTPVPEEVEPSPPKEVKKDSRDSKRSPGGRSKSMESVGRVGRPRSKSRDRAEVESSVAGEDAEVGPPAPPPPPPDPSVTWSFPSPAHFCRVNLVSELVLAMPLGDTLTAASVESTDVSQSLEPIEGDGIAVPAIEPPPPMAIVVETSDNGRDFVPIAESIYESERVGLSWIATERALYWRLRLRHMPPEATISISAVRWFASVGTAAALQPAPTSTVTNTAYATWVREAFNYEEYFCKQCRLGFDQAKSKDSKLREPDDIDPWGLTAETIWKLKKKYQAFISKIAKDTARGTEPPEGPYFSPDRGLATDVMYYFLRSADKFDSNIADLIELIANPINFSKAMTYCKADSHWFYPHFEVKGELADDFHSFAQANASFGVYWSLSLPLQRNLNALEQPTPMSPLSPHIASPMFTVSITKTGWRASDAFPHLPFLYHAGFSGRPMTMVFTLNDMHFTPAYNLQIPGSKPLPIDFPFTVGAGVNFLHHGYLAQCPAPVFDRLRYIYTPKFLDEYRTVIVLTTLSLRSKSAKVRFSLPAHGMDFGIPGLEIDCLQFEVTMAARPPPASASGEVEEEASTPRYMDCDYEINFVSHGARYRASTKDNDHDAPRWIPFSIMGSFDRAGTPSFTLSGRSPSGSVAMATLPGVKLTDIHFSALVMTGDTPQSFQRPRVKVEATLLLPFGLAVRCHYTLLASNCLFGEMEDGLYLHTLGVSLGDFLLLIQWFQGVVVRSSVDALPQLKLQTWTELLPITLSMQLRISVAQQDLHGTGMMRIYDRTATDVTVFANCDGVSLSASVPRLKVGEIELESSPTDRPVYVYVGTSVKSLSKGEKSRLASGVSVHLDGYCALLSSTPLPAKLQLTKAGSLLVCTGRTMDVCVEDMGYSPSGSWGQVAIRADVFIRLLVEHLKDAPIVQSLMAHGVPFSLSSPEVTSSVCSIRQRRLVLTAKGVFFGSYFSVSTVVDDPEDTVVQVEDSTSGLALRIVEQCEEALWSSYSNVVGCRTSSDSAAPIPLMDEDDAESQKALQHHFATKEGAFLSRWIHREVQAFDSTMRAIGFE